MWSFQLQIKLVSWKFKSKHLCHYLLPLLQSSVRIGVTSFGIRESPLSALFMISMFLLLKTLAYHAYYMMEKIKAWDSFILIIYAKRLIPIHSVKYLRVLLDKHMSWNEQIYQTKLKLNCAIGILSKLCIHTNVNILRIAYYSLFQTHLQYDMQLWGQKNQEIKEIMQKHQNHGDIPLARKSKCGKRIC